MTYTRLKAREIFRDLLIDIAHPGAWLRLMVGFALLNLPFWLLQVSHFLGRPWLNIELLLPLVLVIRRPAWATFALILLWGLDLASSQSRTFYFNSTLDFFHSAVFLSSVHLRSFLTVQTTLLIVPAVICGTTAFVVMRWRKPPSGTGIKALILGTIVTLLDVANGSSMLSNRSVRIVSGNPAGSPTITLAARAFWASKTPSLARLAAGSSATEMAQVTEWAKAHPSSSVLFVLVESMGWHNDSLMRQWLIDRLLTNRTVSNYSAEVVKVPFSGSTTFGELRELCGLRGNFRELTGVNTGSCLPRQLHSFGWETLGLHGFSGRMFSRNEWWSSIGLDQRLFAEDLFQINSPLCGAAFAGLCDADVLAKGVALADKEKRFVYVLTLNSHLPLPESSIQADLSALCEREKVGHDVCQLTSVLGHTLTALEQELNRLRNQHPLVVVVGDHAPPFSATRNREQYSQAVVPALLLIPR